MLDFLIILVCPFLYSCVHSKIPYLRDIVFNCKNVPIPPPYFKHRYLTTPRPSISQCYLITILINQLEIYHVKDLHISTSSDHSKSAFDSGVNLGRGKFSGISTQSLLVRCERSITNLCSLESNSHMFSTSKHCQVTSPIVAEKEAGIQS